MARPAPRNCSRRCWPTRHCSTRWLLRRSPKAPDPDRRSTHTMAETPTPQGSQDSALQGVEYQGSDFLTLLNKEFKPKSDEAKSAVQSAVLTLAQQALSQTKLVSTDVINSIESMIAELDRKLT